MTYTALLQAVEARVAWLRQQGCRRTSRVAIAAPNGITLAVTLLGVASGCTAMPLNPRLTESEWRHYLLLLQADLLLLDGHLDPEHHGAARAAAGELGIATLTLPPLQKPVPIADPSWPDDPWAGDRPGGDDTAMVLLTSGSTGTPKRVPLSHRNLRAATCQVVNSLRLAADDRCLCLWEQHHIGGVVDLLLAPLTAGGTVVLGGGFEATQCWRLLLSQQPTWFQAVPTSLIELVRTRPCEATAASLAPLRFIRCVAAALPPQTERAIEEIFAVPVVKTFGMTEASPLITSTPLPEGAEPPGVQPRPGWLGRSWGTDVAVMDRQGSLLPAGVEGEVVIRGEAVMLGYEDDPEANRQAFQDGWFRTGDIGLLEGNGDLILRGRLREMINRGGEQVWPGELDDLLQAHPDVREAAAFAIPHPSLGETVALALVARPGSGLTEADVLDFLENRLSRFKWPQRIVFTDRLPRNATGKIPRHRLIELLPEQQRSTGPTPRSAGAPASGGHQASGARSRRKARRALEQRILRIWSEVLERGDIAPTLSFSAQGGDSLSALRLLSAIEREFGQLGVPMKRLEFTSPRAMARSLHQQPTMATASARATAPEGSGDLEAVEARIQQVVNLSDLPRHPSSDLLWAWHLDGTQPPLFWCCNDPATELPALAKALGDDQPLFGLFSGGAVVPYDAATHRRMGLLWQPEIQRGWPSGALRLGGNCRGALVMHQVAELFRAAGREPEQLIVMEAFQPGLLRYPGRLLLLYGKESERFAHRAFRFGRPGWRRQFMRPPQVGWLPGSHGTFFRPESVADLATQIRATLSPSEPGPLWRRELHDVLLTTIHAHPRLFELYRRWNGWRRSRRSGG